MLLCLLLLFCGLLSVNFDWSIILIWKLFGAGKTRSEIGYSRKRSVTCKLQICSKDRPNSSHERVAIIDKHDLDASEVDTTATSEFAAASLGCKDLKKPIILGCMYRPTDKKLNAPRTMQSSD